MADQSPTYTWPSLLAIVPAPTSAESELYALGVPKNDLIERGTKIRSQKILTDLVRLGGIAAEFWPKATPAQKRHLLGFSFSFLKVLVHSGKKLDDMLAARDSTVDQREGNRAAAFAIADQTYAQGIDERDRLFVALESIETLIPGFDARIIVARGTVSDHDSLAASLHALVKLAQELLASPQSKAAEQLVDGGLSTNELGIISAIADAVKTTGEQAAGARTQGAVSQADLDLQDGTCLAHLERVMRIFNRAHERDASIPRLLPIATRRMFSFGRKRAGDSSPPAAEPSP